MCAICQIEASRGDYFFDDLIRHHGDYGITDCEACMKTVLSAVFSCVDEKKHAIKDCANKKNFKLQGLYLLLGPETSRMLGLPNL